MIARTRRAPEWSAGKYPLFEEAQAGLWSDRKCRNEGEGSLASFKYYYVEAWELRNGRWEGARDEKADVRSFNPTTDIPPLIPRSHRDPPSQWRIPRHGKLYGFVPEPKPLIRPKFNPQLGRPNIFRHLLKGSHPRAIFPISRSPSPSPGLIHYLPPTLASPDLAPYSEWKKYCRRDGMPLSRERVKLKPYMLSISGEDPVRWRKGTRSARTMSDIQWEHMNEHTAISCPKNLYGT
ncbi:hypothetical protein AAMO2058_000601700 [Amorphochlora amoebiformis]